MSTPFTLTMIGVGNAWAKKNFNNSALIEVNGKKILIDGGGLGWYALAELGLDVQDIDAYVVTHKHADHIGHLEEAGFKALYILQRPVPLYLPKPMDDIWETSLRGGLENTSEGKRKMEDYFDVTLMEHIQTSDNAATTEIFGLPFTLVPTEHIPGLFSCGFVLDYRVWFSGDATFNENVIKHAAKRAEAIFHDAQSWTGGVHASIDELGTLPEEIRKKIYLMHYADDAIDKFGPNPHDMQWAIKGNKYQF